MSALLTREAAVDSRTQAGALVGVGLALWALATLLFRLVGQALLPAGDPGRVALVFVVTVPLMAMVAFAVYSLLGVDPERRLTAATLLVVPGMVLDALVVTTFGAVLPNMAPSLGSTFGGLLLLAYASVLVTGLVPLTYVGEPPSRDGSSDRTPDATPDPSENDTAGEE
jgi:membrane-associated PAP2 superfamily phosphatase